jgi:hypothetical protein
MNELRALGHAMRRPDRMTSLLICLGFVAARTWSYADVLGRKPPLQPDSIDYLHASSLPLTHSLFWTYWKPWGLPLLYKLLPGSHAVATGVQFAIATGAWLVLALTAASLLRQPVAKVLALATILAFALTPLVAEWDGQLLTESLSNSLTVLMVAASLLFVRKPTRLRLLLVVLAAFAATMTRDTNAYLAAFVLVPIGIAVAVRGRRQLGLLLAGAVVLISALQVWSYNVRRWQPPLEDVIMQRVLPDPTALQYFRARGMPVRAGLGNELSINRVPPTKVVDQAPELAYFRPWFATCARSTYLRYLVTHPDASLGEPLRQLDYLVAPPRARPYGLDGYRPPGYRDVLPHLAIRALFSENGWAVLGAMIAALTLAVASWRASYADRTWLVPALMLISTVPLAVIVYNGDAIGVQRHALVVAITARLGLIVLGLFLVDAVWSALVELGRRRHPAVPASSS